MTLEVLVSTMNRDDVSLINTMNIKSDALIINQSTSNDKNHEAKDCFSTRMLTYNERGLSKSRNRALQNAKGDICLIADDDIRYYDNYVDLVIRAHEQYPDYDIIAFPVPTTNKSRTKTYYRSKKRLGFISSLKVASFEISFKREPIMRKDIRFDEKFGAGSGQHSMGEENIFIYQCLRKGLKVQFLPIEIGTVTHENSTWFFGYNEKYFIDLGACYAAMSPKYSKLLSLQFLLRKYNRYNDAISITRAFSKMLEGRKIYLNGF